MRKYTLEMKSIEWIYQIDLKNPVVNSMILLRVTPGLINSKIEKAVI